MLLNNVEPAGRLMRSLSIMRVRPRVFCVPSPPPHHFTQFLSEPGFRPARRKSLQSTPGSRCQLALSDAGGASYLRIGKQHNPLWKCPEGAGGEKEHCGWKLENNLHAVFLAVRPPWKEWDVRRLTKCIRERLKIARRRAVSSVFDVSPCRRLHVCALHKKRQHARETEWLSIFTPPFAGQKSRTGPQVWWQKY